MMLYYKQTNNLVYIQRKAAQWNGWKRIWIYREIAQIFLHCSCTRRLWAAAALHYEYWRARKNTDRKKKMFSQLNFNLHQFKAFSLNLTIEMNLFTEYITLTPSWQFETWKFFGWNTSCRGVVAWGGEQQRIYNEHELDALFDGFCSTAARRWWWQKEENEIHRVSDEVEDKVKNFHTRYKFSFQLQFKSRVKLSTIRLQSFIHGYRRKRKKEGKKRKKMCWKHFLPSHSERALRQWWK